RGTGPFSPLPATALDTPRTRRAPRTPVRGVVVGLRGDGAAVLALRRHTDPDPRAARRSPPPPPRRERLAGPAAGVGDRHRRGARHAAARGPLALGAAPDVRLRRRRAATAAFLR